MIAQTYHVLHQALSGALPVLRDLIVNRRGRGNGPEGEGYLGKTLQRPVEADVGNTGELI